MDQKETTILTEVSYKALNYPEKVTSEDFMCGYNIIFHYCAKPTNTYEIRGHCIYDLLQTVLNKYTLNLSAFNSLEEFTCQFEKLEKSRKLLEGIFSYLNRYFIKTNIIKRNEREIKEIRQMIYNFYYENHLKNYKDMFLEIFFFEFDLFRKKETDSMKLRESFSYFKKVLVAVDNDALLVKFKNDFIRDIKKRVNFNESIKIICMNVYQELINLNSIFDSAIAKDLNEKTVEFLSDRREEMCDKVIKRIDSQKEILFIYKLIEFLGEDAVKIFNFKFEFYLKNKKMSFDFTEMFGLFSYFYKLIDKNMERNEEISKIVKDLFGQSIQSFYKNENFDRILEFERKLTAEIEKVFVKRSLKEKSLIHFVKLVKENKRIGEKIIEILQRNLLFNDNIMDYEPRLVDLLSQILSSDDFYKCCHLMNDLRRSNEFVYQNLRPKLLSKGSWPLKEECVILHEKLRSIFSDYVNYLGKDYTRSLFIIMPRISKMTIEFNGCTFDINTDLVSLLYHIEEKVIMDYKSLLECTNDPNLKDNLSYLLSKELIIEFNDTFSINYNFKTEEKDLFRIHTEIFLSDKDKLPVNNNQLLESLIIKILKNKKKVPKNELFIFLNIEKFDGEKIQEALNNLVRKMYCTVKDGIIEYLP